MWGSEMTTPSFQKLKVTFVFERKDKYRKKVSVYAQRPDFEKLSIETGKVAKQA